MKQGNPQLTAPMIALFAGVAGLVVGSVVVFAAMRNQATKVALQPTGPAPAAAKPPATVPGPSDPLATATTPEGEQAPASGAEAVPPIAPSAGAATAGPTNPAVPPPASQIGGVLPSSTDPLVPPMPEVSLREPEVRLVRLNVYTSNPEQAQSELATSLTPLGGQVRKFVDFGTTTQEPSAGLLILIPESGVDKLVGLVQSQNSNVATQSWKTTVASRQARLEDEAQAALFELKAKRQSLLVKYFEDATPVKVVDEAIAQVEDSLKKLRIPADSQQLAAVKITFGPRG